MRKMKLKIKSFSFVVKMSAETDIMSLLNKRADKDGILQEMDDDVLLKMANDEIEQLLKDLKGLDLKLDMMNYLYLVRY